MKNVKEREVLAQLYANEADVIKYLPFFFEDRKQLVAFIDMFRGKTLRIPTSYQEYLEKYLKTDPPTPNRSIRGVNGTRKMKDKMIESYLSLFSSLQDALKNECGKK